MPSYQELIQQRASLELEIQRAREHEISAAIAKIKELVQCFELTHKDIFPTKSNKRNSASTKIKPKYRNPETGDTWTGRGKAPKWIRGVDLNLFLIL
jgi:DNA-binding protein H-NS